MHTPPRTTNLLKGRCAGKVCTDLTELSPNEGTADTKKVSLRQFTCRRDIHMRCSAVRNTSAVDILAIVSSALNSLGLPDHFRSSSYSADAYARGLVYASDNEMNVLHS